MPGDAPASCSVEISCGADWSPTRLGPLEQMIARENHSAAASEWLEQDLMEASMVMLDGSEMITACGADDPSP